MSIQLRLGDQSQSASLSLPMKGYEIAKEFFPDQAKKVLLLKVDGKLWDLTRDVETAKEIELLTLDHDDTLEVVRHDAAHIMAEAVQELFPGTKVTIGPVIEEGFYYDFDRDEPFSIEDLDKIEKRMKEIIKRNEKITREVWSRNDARKFYEERGENYKVELIDDIPENEDLSFYRQGEFIDMCRGPHLPATGASPLAFELLNVAGAYWRGDEKRPMLQRIYGTAWRNKDELDHHLHQLEERKKRDHRVLGKKYKIFMTSKMIGAGLPIWLPNGTIVKKELEQLATIEERRDGYFPVSTPILARDELYYQSGHLPYYEDDMYNPIDIDGENMRLRPMNCPHHHQVFSSDQRSYRDLPLRIAEYGNVFRYEDSGGLSGLMRVRGFCQNDAHIYCTYEQAKDEFLAVMKLHQRYYDLFEIENYYMRFSLPDLAKLDKYVDDREGWLAAMDIIRAAMDESGLPYKEVEGEAAFYGPKIDFMIKSATGTEYAISTNQLDFVAAKRFNLVYTGTDGAEHPVYVIHRAPLGSHERFVAFLLEHYAGKFPTWLAPNQVTIIPVGGDQEAYAKEVHQKLFAAPIMTATGGLRVNMDLSNESLGKRIRAAAQDQIPYVLVLGKREEENQTITIRARGGDDLGSCSLDTFLDLLQKEIATRSDLSMEDRQKFLGSAAAA